MKIFFGKNLGYLLKKKNESRQDLAKFLNISVNTISNYATNTSLPNLNTIVRIVNYLDVDLNTMVLVDIAKEDISKDKSILDVEDRSDEIIRSKNQKYTINTDDDQLFGEPKDILILELRNRIDDLKSRIKFQEELILKIYSN
ncbi:helix-turn-helix domain-containing protein [Aureispira anguillae]|uniref:Helix-turn-helix domain-containing protein n=1 Tax=Aureispira anguillae TaxID=2864201 RepID=A0A915YJB8_9BACT|nr:helix-turn-helix transcriptional regulator [Aureispira anguillae]BDS14074.1 helix-turn-helix domain-containing protein [Aureispira anguillae]